MNYIESEILINDSNRIFKMIPKKEEILDWIKELNTKKNHGAGGGIDEEKLEEIICDIIVYFLYIQDLKKKNSSYKGIRIKILKDFLRNERKWTN